MLMPHHGFALMWIWRYLHHFSESRSSNRSTLSIHLSVRLSTTLFGCLICVICNSKSFHSILFKLCIMVVHILKMCTYYFVRISWIFSQFLGMLNLDIFPSKKMHSWFLVCVICNSQQFSFLYFQTLHNDCSHIEDVHLPFCAHLIDIFSFLSGVEP